VDLTLSNELLSTKLKAFARNLGFDDVGIASVDGDLPFIDEVALAHRDGRFGPLDYLEKTLSARLGLRTVFPEAKTVVVVVKNYYTKDHKDYDPQASKRAKIARYAWGKDYHQWFKKKLKAFKPFLEEVTGQEVKVWPFNDTSPFLERAWAFKSGLGFIGKSAMFIHRGLGTWTLLGGVATDLAVTPDKPYSGPDCGSCTKCMDACPTKAIIKPHTLDANKCISTWTIERPLHPLAFEKAPRDHSWAFGCDICQEVCPWNKFQSETHEERFQPMPGRIFLTKETFEQDLAGSPLYRSRKAGLLANFLRIQKSLEHANMKSIMGDR
jgi:epoxyqueuosine reductase